MTVKYRDPFIIESTARLFLSLFWTVKGFPQKFTVLDLAQASHIANLLSPLSV